MLSRIAPKSTVSAGRSVARALFKNNNAFSSPAATKSFASLSAFSPRTAQIAPRQQQTQRVNISVPFSFVLRFIKVAAKDLRKGDIIKHNGKQLEVISAEFNKNAMRKAMVLAELRDIKTGKKFDEHFRSIDTVETLFVEKGEYEFLRRDEDNDAAIFQDASGDEISVPAKLFDRKYPFLEEGMKIELSKIDDEFIEALMPEHLEAEVAEAEPFSKTASVTQKFKQIVLTNGVKVQAPAFINKGDRIIINGSTLEYVGKADE